MRTTKTFNFHGLPIRIGSDEECRAADYVVCTRTTCPNPFTDNLVRPCCVCGADLYMRPTMPTETKTICLECFTQQLADEQP
jgi:hypothetical protein